MKIKVSCFNFCAGSLGAAWRPWSKFRRPILVRFAALVFVEIHVLQDGRLFVLTNSAQLYEFNPISGQRRGFRHARWTVHVPYALGVSDTASSVLDLRSGVQLQLQV
jgi:hypothetical protein